MRALADDDGKRVKLVLGAATLLVWVAVFWACWAILDWCDDQIPQWAGYLNSQASAHMREPGSSPMSTSSAGSRWPSGFCAGLWCRPR